MKVKNNAVREFDDLCKERNALHEKMIINGPVLKGSVVDAWIPSGKVVGGRATGPKKRYTLFSYLRDGKKTTQSIDSELENIAKEFVSNYKNMTDIIAKMTDVNLDILDISKHLKRYGQVVSRKNIGEYYVPYFEGKEIWLRTVKLMEQENEKLRGLLKRVSKMSGDEFKEWKRRSKKDLRRKYGFKVKPFGDIECRRLRFTLAQRRQEDEG